MHSAGMGWSELTVGVYKKNDMNYGTEKQMHLYLTRTRWRGKRRIIKL